jgi:uncharacterized Tic20 family protein
MADYCSNCGASSSGASFCPSCGASTGGFSSQQSNSNTNMGYAPIGNTSTAMWAHLGGLLAYFFGGTVFGWIPPLIIRTSVAARQDRYVYEQATEALNFHLQWLIIDAGLLVITFITCGIGGFLYLPAVILVVVFGIMATVATSSGQNYRYPMMMFRLVK